MAAGRLTRRRFGTGLLLAGPFGAAAPGGFEWVAGPYGSDWFAMATGLADLVRRESPDLAFDIVPGGAAANPTRVQAGLSQMGFGFDDLAHAARAGTAPYTTPHGRLVALGAGYASLPHHFIRHAAGPAAMEAILTQPRLRIGVPRFGTPEARALDQVMRFYGRSPDGLRATGGRHLRGSYSELVAAWNDGRVDYLYIVAATPAPPVEEIVQGRRRAALVPFPEALLAHLNMEGGFGEDRIRLGTYRRLQGDDIAVAATRTVLLASDALPEEAARRMVGTIIRHAGGRLAAIHPALAAFVPRLACRTAGLPLHPGAAAAFAGVCPPTA